MTAAAWGQTRTAELFFTYYGSLHDHVFRVDNECYVSPATLRSIGWQVEERDGNAIVRADDRRGRVAMRRVGDTPCVPLSDLLDMMGLSGQWESDRNRFDVISTLNAVRYKNGKFSIDAVLPIKTSVSLLKSPARTIIDLAGAKLAPETKLLLQDGAQITQFRPDVVRVMIDGTLPNPRLPSNDEVAKNYEVNIGTPADAPIMATPSSDEDPPDPNIAQAPSAAQAPRNSLVPITVGPIDVTSEGAASAVLTLPLSGPLRGAPTFRRPDPNELDVVLPGASLNLGTELGSPDPASIQSVQATTEGNSAVLALHLVRPMGIEISTAPGALKIRLLKPSVGNGQLAGKLVVVDAGHGGHDSGAKTFDGSVMEKNLTLAIAKLTAEKLAEEGATVIMTRKTDDFITLEERPGIANRNHADFFISIHINANGLDTKSSGSITFYHLTDPISQVLAACLLSEIKKVSGIPAIGVWSDGKIYHSGFAVLRYSKMPAVLIECGFINNASDLKHMKTDDFKESIAGAIVQGLKVYLGQK